MLPRIVCGIFGTALATAIISTNPATAAPITPSPSCKADLGSSSSFTFQASQDAKLPEKLSPLPDIGFATADRNNSTNGIRVTTQKMPDRTIRLMWTYRVSATWQQRAVSPITESGFSWTLNGVNQPIMKGQPGPEAGTFIGEIPNLKNGDVISYRDHYSFQANVGGMPGTANDDVAGTIRLNCLPIS